jgi:hypothetical protein
LKAQALWDASDQLRRTLAVTSYRPADAALAAQSVQRSLTALQSTLSSPAGTAPSAAAIVRRIDTMLVEVQDAIRPMSTTPAAPTPGGLNATTQKLLAQAQSASRGVESLLQSLTGQSYQDYNARVVVRDLDALAARLDELQTSIRRNTSRERLQWEVEGLSEQAARIAPSLLAGRPPALTRLFWNSVTSSLEQLADTLGVPAGGSTTLRPTPPQPQVLSLVDQALSRADVFLTGTQPLIFGVPEVPRVQRDVRNVKSRLLTLRHQAHDGEPAAQQLETLGSMVADYQSAYSNWNQIVARYKLQNPPRLSPVGEALNEVERLLNLAADFDDLTLVSGSVSSARTARLLETLATELRLFRDALPAAANYPEHRALLNYCDQLEGYLTSMVELQQNPAAAPDALRRQAAGAQRVGVLLAANAEAVEARAPSAAARASGTRLAGQARRLAGLASDLESEVQ